MNFLKFQISLKALILLNTIILLIIGGLIFFLIFNKNNNLLSLKNASVETPYQFFQTSSLNTDKSTIFESKNILENNKKSNKEIEIKKLIGYIKNLYEKNGKIYMDFDITSDCISENYEVAKAMIEDGKCLPNATFEEVSERLKDAPFSNLTEICPNQYFGYGVGYCYFGNTSTEAVTFEIHPEVIVLYNIYPYDFDTKQHYQGAQNYQISLKTFREDYYPKYKSEIFEIKAVNNVVFAIIEYFIPKE